MPRLHVMSCNVQSPFSILCMLCAFLQGNGFITDKDLISKYGLSDANGFFSALWDKPYVDKVCSSFSSLLPTLLSTLH